MKQLVQLYLIYWHFSTKYLKMSNIMDTWNLHLYKFCKFTELKCLLFQNILIHLSIFHFRLYCINIFSIFFQNHLLIFNRILILSSVSTTVLVAVLTELLVMLNIELPCDPAISLLGIYQEKTIIWKDTLTTTFLAALFVIAKTWRQLKYPLTD